MFVNLVRRVPRTSLQAGAGAVVFLSLLGILPARADLMGFLIGGKAESEQRDRYASESRGFGSRTGGDEDIVRIERSSPVLPASSGGRGWRSEQNPGGVPRPKTSPAWRIARNLAYPQSESSVLSRLGTPSLELDHYLEFTDFNSRTVVVLNRRLDPDTPYRRYIITGASVSGIRNH